MAWIANGIFRLENLFRFLHRGGAKKAVFSLVASPAATAKRYGRIVIFPFAKNALFLQGLGITPPMF